MFAWSWLTRCAVGIADHHSTPPPRVVGQLPGTPLAGRCEGPERHCSTAPHMGDAACDQQAGHKTPDAPPIPPPDGQRSHKILVVTLGWERERVRAKASFCSAIT